MKTVHTCGLEVEYELGRATVPSDWAFKYQAHHIYYRELDGTDHICPPLSERPRPLYVEAESEPQREERPMRMEAPEVTEPARSRAGEMPA